MLLSSDHVTLKKLTHVPLAIAILLVKLLPHINKRHVTALSRTPTYVAAYSFMKCSSEAESF